MANKSVERAGRNKKKAGSGPSKARKKISPLVEQRAEERTYAKIASLERSIQRVKALDFVEWKGKK